MRGARLAAMQQSEAEQIVLSMDMIVGRPIAGAHLVGLTP
jgi:hypothetical protein